MNPTHNVVGWFEIPVADMKRAVSFYQTVFGYQLQHAPMGELDMAWFPAVEGTEGSPGALACHKDFYFPGNQGAIVYFTAFSGDLANELSKVPDAGGKVLMEKKLIADDIGYMGLFEDTEGNRIAIHSRR